jgi:hypothetical protein
MVPVQPPEPLDSSSEMADDRFLMPEFGDPITKRVKRLVRDRLGKGVDAHVEWTRRGKPFTVPTSRPLDQTQTSKSSHQIHL